MTISTLFLGIVAIGIWATSKATPAIPKAPAKTTAESMIKNF